MNAPPIRPLTPDALDDALVLSSTAGWNQRLEDWRVLLALAPHGCFAAWNGHRVVGTAIGIDYGGFGWIAMMLVDPDWRGRGLGRRLLDAAMDAIPPDRTIRLDATPLGRPLYESAGFLDEAAITRHVRPPGASGEAPAPPARPTVRSVRRATLADIPHLASYDRDVFGGDRRLVFEWAIADRPECAWIHAGDPPQYCLGRKGRLFNQIGPVVAVDDETACAVAREAIEATPGGALTVDAVDAWPVFTAWLRQMGFEAQRPLFRMWRPPASGSGRGFTRAVSPLAERAILGPEFA